MFAEQVILHNLAMDKPIIHVTTECGSSEAEKSLKERGLGDIEPGLLNYVDAYNETVGVALSNRVDTVNADCNDLSSIDIAISRTQERLSKKGVLLVFDSLTTPYLFTGPDILRFMRQTLSRFAAHGNAVFACIDEGCGKSEDLVAMMTLSNAVLNIIPDDGKRVLNIVKHPHVEQTKIEVPTKEAWEKRLLDWGSWDRETIRRALEGMQSGGMDRFAVNIYWLNFARWSSMLWDPNRFPGMTYEFMDGFMSSTREFIKLYPWHTKLLFKLFVPSYFSKVKDMKRGVKFLKQTVEQRKYGIFEYLEDQSKTDEHYFRIYENFECWEFENIGSKMALLMPPMFAGLCKGMEKEERNWNCVETKCIGLGDPCCEFKLVRTEIKDLKSSMQKDITVLERIHKQQMKHLMGFLLEDKPLMERPSLGADFIMVCELALSSMSERYRMAMRTGGTKSGKEVGQNLMNVGQSEDEAVKSIIHFLDHCKVGNIVANETLRIIENCESRWTRFFATKWKEPSCFFTTGFLNGFFSAVKKLHVKETKCIAMGDPYCEWEFR
jgi:predicted hydrocarbon binding protein